VAHGDMVLAYIGLGGNLDSGATQPAQTLLQAASELNQLPHSRLIQLSPLYRSAPIGHDDQPDFINAVAALQTRLSAIELLGHLQALEQQHGRQRSPTQRNGPRTLDLDLLLYGQDAEQCIDLPTLQVPHPRLHQRAFVLRPLADIAPALHIPGQGPLSALLPRVSAQVLRQLPADADGNAALK
jgi:2-amino-4-hydroxy-6-hydroxymethyldihydropteridine diphosphokinase